MNVCSICGGETLNWNEMSYNHKHNSEFLKLLNVTGIEGYYENCRICNSTENERFLWLLTENELSTDQLSILAINVSELITDKLKKHNRTEKLHIINVDGQLNASMQGVFDYVLINNYFSKVQNIELKISELLYYLKGNGTMLIKEAYSSKLLYNFELIGNVSDGIRSLLYGGLDFRRVLGKNFQDFFTNNNFKVEAINISQLGLSPAVSGIHQENIIFRVRYE